MVEPVVVYPETLSNQALINVNSPPHKTYGSMPKINERSQDRTMVRNPSYKDKNNYSHTKIKRNEPKRSKMMKLINNGAKAESRPFIMDTTMDRNINNALTSSALPILTDIAFTFIALFL